MNIVIEMIKIAEARIFRYLGSLIDAEGTYDAIINQRIEEMLKLYYVTNNKFIRERNFARYKN